MIFDDKIFPVTVIVAVILFILKEVFEEYRRFRSNARRMHALQRMLSAECERNHFSISRLKQQINEIAHAIDAGNDIEIENRDFGKQFLTIVREVEGRVTSKSPIPLIHTDMLEKYLFDAASVDAKMFSYMEKTLEAMNEMLHVRDGLPEYILNDRVHLDGFLDYAKRVIDNSIDPLRDLYLYCTGEPLVQGRVR